MADEFEEKLNSFIERSTAAAKSGADKLIGRLDAEKKKAEIRSEIGHNARDLSKAYEKLGRDYYNSVVMKTSMSDSSSTMDLIRSKEKLIELLNEKLDSLDK